MCRGVCLGEKASFPKRTCSPTATTATTSACVRAAALCRDRRVNGFFFCCMFFFCLGTRPTTTRYMLDDKLDYTRRDIVYYPDII